MAGFLRLLKAVTYGWLLAWLSLLRRLLSLLLHRRHETSAGEHERKRVRTTCAPIEDPAFKRPDPFVYAQYFLRDKGLNVTWNNPDFALFRDGVPVASHELSPHTVYDVVVRVWNAAFDCPVVAMPVHLLYLSFGVGTESHPVATDTVDVGVRGSPSNPGYARFKWRTPSGPGHYCLQARLEPVADVEWGNNLGQHNIDVATAHSPAIFSFMLRNGPTARREFRFEVDAYDLGPIAPCVEDPAARQKRLDHQTQPHPLPEGWSVSIEPPSPLLGILEEIAVQVAVTPPADWTGSQIVNVHTYYVGDSGALRPAGGVTLTVKHTELPP